MEAGAGFSVYRIRALRGSGKKRQCGETAAASLSTSAWTLFEKANTNAQPDAEVLLAFTIREWDHHGGDNAEAIGITDDDGLHTDSTALVCRIWRHCVCRWMTRGGQLLRRTPGITLLTASSAHSRLLTGADATKPLPAPRTIGAAALATNGTEQRLAFIHYQWTTASTTTAAVSFTDCVHLSMSRPVHNCRSLLIVEGRFGVHFI